MNQVSRWLDCKYCLKKINGSSQYVDHKQQYHEKEYEQEINNHVLVWCDDCKTRVSIPSMHLNHPVRVTTLGNVTELEKSKA